MSASIRPERVLAPADELVVHVVRAHDVVELGEPQVEDVLLLAEHVGLHEALGLSQQGLLVHEVAADHAVLRVLAVPDEGPHPVDHPLGLVGLPLPVRQGPQALQHVLFLRPRLLPPLLEAPRAGARLEVPDVAEDHGHERGGALAPPRPRDVDLADAAHAVLVEPRRDGVSRLPPARELGQLVQEALILDVLQERHHLRMRADHVRDVQERQPHLRRDVVGNRLGKRVGRVLLAQPLLQLVVEPPRGLHRRHEHLMAPRIEQDPPQLLHVRLDEVEQRLPGRRRDVAFRGGDRRPALLDQLGDDGRIGLDRIRRAAEQRRGWTAPIETDPAIVTELIDESRASVAAAEREIVTLSGEALLDFIQADIQELRRLLFDPRSHQVFMSAMEATWWLNDHLRSGWARRTSADTLTQSVPTTSRRRWGWRCWTLPT